MSPPRVGKKGERCRVSSGGASVVGVVALAGKDGTALAVTFEALRTASGLHVNGVALLWDDRERVYLDVKGSGDRFTLAETEVDS